MCYWKAKHSLPLSLPPTHPKTCHMGGWGRFKNIYDTGHGWTFCKLQDSAFLYPFFTILISSLSFYITLVCVFLSILSHSLSISFPFIYLSFSIAQRSPHLMKTRERKNNQVFTGSQMASSLSASLPPPPSSLYPPPYRF